MARNDSTSKPKPIRAVAYGRKSTLEESTEKSIADQIARIKALAPPDGGKYDIARWYTSDKGVPGWKRGAKRPDFFRLVNELKETGAKAILVDDMDRFSRADQFEVMHEVQELREHHGIRYIHAANQGCMDLITDQCAAMKIAMYAMSGHEFSTRLSRRLANARLDAALKGHRSGGRAPYGFTMAGEDGKPITPETRHDAKGKERRGKLLIFGDPKEVRTVRWIFDQFVNRLKSMNWIAADLNKRGIPASHGGKWYVAAIKELLQRREYRGDFSYNAKKSGEFHIINGERKVVPVNRYDEQEQERKRWKPTDEGRIIIDSTHRPMVKPSLWDAAQERLSSFSLKGTRRPRADGYPLSRILVCDHCGKPMYGCHPTGRKHRVYRCSTNAKKGMGTCGTYEIREELILPKVMKMLAEEINDIHALLSRPPEDLIDPDKHKEEDHAAAQKGRDKLAAQIKQATRNVMLCDDERTRREMDQEITAMRDELAKLDARLADQRPGTKLLKVDGEVVEITNYTNEQLEAINRWWEDFMARAVSVPLKDGHDFVTIFHKDPFADDPAVLVDARVVNEALHALGAEIRLRWKTSEVTLSTGRKVPRHTLVRGRFRMGQKSVSFHIAPTGAPSNGTGGAGRRGSRRGRGSTRPRA